MRAGGRDNPKRNHIQRATCCLLNYCFGNELGWDSVVGINQGSPLRCSSRINVQVGLIERASVAIDQCRDVSSQSLPAAQATMALEAPTYLLSAQRIHSELAGKQGSYIKGASPSLCRKANKRACTG